MTTTTDPASAIPPRPRKAQRRVKHVTEWCTVMRSEYNYCILCGSRLKVGSHVLRTTTDPYVSTTVYLEKRCIEAQLAKAPFDEYDKIKSDLEAGKGFNFDG